MARLGLTFEVKRTRRNDLRSSGGRLEDEVIKMPSKVSIWRCESSWVSQGPIKRADESDLIEHTSWIIQIELYFEDL